MGSQESDDDLATKERLPNERNNQNSQQNCMVPWTFWKRQSCRVNKKVRGLGARRVEHGKHW